MQMYLIYGATQERYGSGLIPIDGKTIRKHLADAPMFILFEEIEQAKQFAQSHSASLSKLTRYTLPIVAVDVPDDFELGNKTVETLNAVRIPEGSITYLPDLIVEQESSSSSDSDTEKVEYYKVNSIEGFTLGDITFVNCQGRGGIDLALSEKQQQPCLAL